MLRATAPIQSTRWKRCAGVQSAVGPCGTQFALYYDLPTLSVKGCCYHLMVQSVPGFWVNVSRNVDMAKYKKVSVCGRGADEVKVRAVSWQAEFTARGCVVGASCALHPPCS